MKGKVALLIVPVLVISFLMPLTNGGDDTLVNLSYSNMDLLPAGNPPGWSEDVRLTYVGKCGYPAIAVNGCDIHIVWENATSPYGIYYRKSLDSGKTWTNEMKIDNSGSEAPYEPKIVLNGSIIHVVWDQDTPSGYLETFYTKSIDNGETWNIPVQLSEGNFSNSYLPYIAMEGDNLYVVWQDRRDGQYEVYFKNSSTTGDTWSIDKKLTDYALGTDGPEGIAVNGSKIHVLFNRYVGNWENFYMNSFDGGQTWNAPVAITVLDGANAAGGDIAVNGSSVHIVWDDRRHFDGGEIYYRNSTNNGLTWNDEVRLTDSPSPQGSPSISVEENNIDIVFGDTRTKGDNMGDVWFINSTDGGNTWNSEYRLTYEPFPASTGSGRITVEDNYIYVSFKDNRSNPTLSGFDVYYKRYPDFPPDPTYNITLDEGWNLISIPLNQPDESIDQVLSSIAGKWDCIRTYDSLSGTWKTNITGRPNQLNDFDTLNHKKGFWINITEPNVTLIISGYTPSLTNINLYVGWNLVGYPSLINETVGNALWGTGADNVMVCNMTEPYQIKEVGPTYIMQPGEGYWVHVVADSVWIVDW